MHIKQRFLKSEIDPGIREPIQWVARVYVNNWMFLLVSQEFVWYLLHMRNDLKKINAYVINLHIFESLGAHRYREHILWKRYLLRLER